MANLRIVLTGGHAATAGIAVIDEIRKNKKIKNAQIFWIGSKIAIEGKTISSLESEVLPKLNVTFYPITAGKIQTKFTIHTIPSLFKIPVGFIEAAVALIKIKPKVVLSFGGFASFPVVFWAKVLGIPVIIHEQTVTIGRASKASIPFATRVLLAREESKNYIDRVSTEVVGNPLMPVILSVPKKQTLGNPPTILVIGGSRGSNFLNELMIELVPKLLSNLNVVHITGEEDFESQTIFKESLPIDMRTKYFIYSKIDPLKMGEVYKDTDIAISRSGANTVSELMYLKIPSVFIPLPRTHLDEQVKNAKYATNYGFGVMLTEKEATVVKVFGEVNNLIRNWKMIHDKLQNIECLDIDASKKIVNILSEYC